METNKLFIPAKVGAIELKNHIVMSPMTRCRAIGNVPNDLMAEYYKQRSGAGLIVTEGTSPSPNGLGYARMETTLLRAFDSVPDVMVPVKDEKRPGRIFEIRTYESNTIDTLKRKIGMFNEGEIAIFRKLNMLPVFFGETIVGRNMPNLTYMLAFDDLAAREKAWKAFGTDPDWQKMRIQPGLTDPEVVSNISNSIVQPLALSEIR